MPTWWRTPARAPASSSRCVPSTRTGPALRGFAFEASRTTSTPASASSSPLPSVRSTRRWEAPAGSSRGGLRLRTSTSPPRAASSATSGAPSVPVPPTTAIFTPRSLEELWLAEELRRGNPDQLALEALLAAVDDPGGVDFADVEVEAQFVRVLLDVLHVGQAGVVLAAQQARGDEWLRGHVDHLVPVGEVEVALGRRHDAERARPLDLPAAEQDEVLGRVDEGVDDPDLGPVSLRDLVHLGVGAALDEEGAWRLAQHLQAVEEVDDQLDPVVLDPLEASVVPHRPLVTGPGRAERDEGDRRHLALKDTRLLTGVFLARPAAGGRVEGEAGAAVDHAFDQAEDRPFEQQRRDQLRVGDLTLLDRGRVLVVDQSPDPLDALPRGEPGGMKRLFAPVGILTGLAAGLPGDEGAETRPARRYLRQGPAAARAASAAAGPRRRPSRRPSPAGRCRAGGRRAGRRRRARRRRSEPRSRPGRSGRSSRSPGLPAARPRPRTGPGRRRGRSARSTGRSPRSRRRRLRTGP